MAENSVRVLIISGPVGVGKTSVADEVSNLFNGSGTAHTLLDMDVLGETFPRPHDDVFNRRLALRNLRDVWANCFAVGSRVLILPRVVETLDDVCDIEAVIPGARPTVFQLRASTTTLIQRVRSREIGSGRTWHEKRALELARTLREKAPLNHIIETDDGSVGDIACEIVSLLDDASIGYFGNFR